MCTFAFQLKFSTIITLEKSLLCHCSQNALLNSINQLHKMNENEVLKKNNYKNVDISWSWRNQLEFYVVQRHSSSVALSMRTTLSSVIYSAIYSGEIIYHAVSSIHINSKTFTHWSGAEYLVFWGENRALKKKFRGVMRFHKVTQYIFIGVAENTLSDKIHLGEQSLTN
jgi:hypothetical protein